MKNNHLVIGIAVLGIVVAVLQALASAYYLYWLFWWYDIIMHLLGGMFVTLLYLWFLQTPFAPDALRRAPQFLSLLVVILVVGIGWELFEYAVGAYTSINYSLDTTLDLAMDVVGMMMVYLLLKRI